jgi:EmrB/QacA subfamily drug resistance transporter
MQPTTSLNRRSTLLALAGVALVLFLVSLDQTVVGSAMPKVIAELNGFSLYAWVSTVYLLAETVVLPIVGKLGDMYGRKWITVLGVGLFVGASAFCGMATSMLWLIIGRGLQGLGGGVILATAFTLVADIFPDVRDRARYQGLLFAVFTLSSVIGPTLGGWIADSLGWRWIFYINLPLGLFSLVVLPRLLPQSPRQANARIDYWGALTVTLAVSSLLLALELASNGYGWASLPVISGLVVALITFGLFIWIEQRVSDPIIPLTLFRNRTFVATSSVLFLFGAAMFGVTLYVPLFLQAVLGLSASQSGVALLPMSIVTTVVGIVVGQLVARMGSLRPFLLGGIVIMVVGVGLLATVQATTSMWAITGYMFIIGLGMGAIFPVTTLIVQSAIEPQLLGVATSATQFIRSIGSTMGTALIGTLVTSSYVTQLDAQAPQGVPTQAVDALHSPNALVSSDALQSLNSMLAELPNSNALMEQLLSVARVALTGAIQQGFLLIFGAVLAALVCSLFVARLQLADSTGGTQSVATAH